MERIINLHMFDEGAAAAPVAAEGTGAQPQTAPQLTTSRRRKAGRDPKVVYGTPPMTETPALETAEPEASSEQQPEQKTPEQLNEEFEKLIKGEYKNLFDERVKSILNERFKNNKGMAEENQKMKDAISLLAQKYGTEDLDALVQMISDDSSLFEEQAIESGMSVEQFKEMKKLEMENQRLRAAQQAAAQEEKTRAMFAEWNQQAEEVKKIFPEFDLRSELRNPSFGRLIGNGVDMQTAYQVMHQDEVMKTAMAQTAQAVAQKQAANIEVRSRRPAENGLSSQGGVVVKNDVTKLTRADRRAIAERVARGEHIEFS